MQKSDFEKFALDKGVSSEQLDYFRKRNWPLMGGYINPTVIEERQMNVTTMDVFSRLMLDRILFLGSEIDSDVSNIISAQLPEYLPHTVPMEGLPRISSLRFIPLETTLLHGYAADLIPTHFTAGKSG